MRRSVGVVLAWLAAVAAATYVGVLAVGAIGSGIVPQAQEPLSPDEVTRQLANPGATTPARPSPSPTPSTPSTPSTPEPSAGERKVFGSRGGTVYARCNPAFETGVEILSASPAQGFHFKDEEVEDGGRRVRFEAGDERVEVQINCVGGSPREIPDDDGSDDDHGGDD